MNAELFATETRSEMDMKVITMAETMLQTLSAVLYHRISKRDPNSLITIAAVATVFLPVTVASTIFGSGVLDLFAIYPENSHPVISSTGWSYLGVCLGMSILKYIAWFCLTG